MINIIEVLQNSCSQYNMWPILEKKTCLLGASDENEYPTDKKKRQKKTIHLFARLNIYIVLSAWRPHDNEALCVGMCLKSTIRDSFQTTFR